MYTDVFPKRLKLARENTGATQQEVANVLKISRSTYTNYEAGRSEPSLEIVAQLAKMYNVTMDWLCGLTSESNIGLAQQLKEEMHRQKILSQIEREAALKRRALGVG